MATSLKLTGTKFSLSADFELGPNQTIRLADAPSVRQFGAMGDGVNDDSAKITEALASLSSGGVLYFPIGTYRIESTLDISTNGITLVGEGAGSVLFDPGNVLLLYIKASDVRVRDLKLLGTQSGSAFRQNLIAIGGAGAEPKRVTVQNCYFENASSTCVLVGGDLAPCTDIRIVDNDMLNFYENGIDVVSSGNSRVTVRGNVMRTSVVNPNGAVSRPIGIAMEPQNAGINSDFVVTGNVVDFSALSTANQNTTHGITCNKHGAPASSFVLKRAVFADNVIRAVGHGIRLLDTRYGTTTESATVSITGNVFEAVRNHGIYVAGGEDATHRDSAVVANNTVKGWSEASSALYDGIYLDQNLYTPVVSANIIGRRAAETGAANGRYGVHVVGAGVVGARVSGNAVTQAATALYFDASGSAVVNQPDLVTTGNLTADNQTVTVGTFSTLLLTSDNATPANRTFTLSKGSYAGQRVTLIWKHASNSGQYVDDSTSPDGAVARLSANWEPSEFDALVLVWDGDASWFEVSRSAN